MLFWRRPAFSDGVIDLIPVSYGLPDSRLGFGDVYDFIISPHHRHREAGQISLRLGESEGVYYFGHIGYHIDPPWRGQHWAQRACILLRPLIESAGKSSVVITTDPDNIASQKTITALGAVLERTVDVPDTLRANFEISPRKLRYIWRVNSSLDID